MYELVTSAHHRYRRACQCKQQQVVGGPKGLQVVFPLSLSVVFSLVFQTYSREEFLERSTCDCLIESDDWLIELHEVLCVCMRVGFCLERDLRYRPKRDWLACIFGCAFECGFPSVWYSRCGAAPCSPHPSVFISSWFLRTTR